MKETTKQKIKESGFRMDYLAKKIEVNPVQLSMAFSGKRALPIGKEEKLIEFLSKIPA